MTRHKNLSEVLEQDDPFGWHQERSILETTELICQTMVEENVSRSELARRLKKSKGYVSQLLDGASNMTIRTISDAFTALGWEFHPHRTKISRSEQDVVYESTELGVWGTHWTPSGGQAIQQTMVDVGSK